ncbi:substrate-binding domain-containing protein [Serratia quinivorans]|uniref:substrate-binding domain-containing protein n=1 Tax=Serratia quinivorans TaxID=137545 RepID=UPI0021BD47C8|nr:substrate-binding domain-containing protein [Serratia quinivorans]
MTMLLKNIKHMLLAITGGLIIFSAGAQAKNDKTTIGAIYLDTQGYYAGVRWGVQNGAAKGGGKMEIIETNAQGDVSKESSFIDTMIARDVNAVVLSAVSVNGSVRAIKRANEANIPVICYNTCINEKGVDNYVYAYLVGDPYEFGKKLGNTAADYFIEKKITEPAIAVINCEAFEVCVQRRKGFEDALKAKVPGMKIVANQEGTVLDKAISVGEKLLISSGNVDAIFGESGGATLGAVKAVRNQNKVGKTVVFGSDMTTEIAQELVNRQVLQAVVDISGKKMGALVFTQAMNAINRQPVGQKVVQVPIDLYASSQSATDWLATHKDGLP